MTISRKVKSVLLLLLSFFTSILIAHRLDWLELRQGTLFIFGINGVTLVVAWYISIEPWRSQEHVSALSRQHFSEDEYYFVTLGASPTVKISVSALLVVIIHLLVIFGMDVDTAAAPPRVTEWAQEAERADNAVLIEPISVVPSYLRPGDRLPYPPEPTKK